MNIGADVRPCLRFMADYDGPADADHIREMVTQLWDSVHGSLVDKMVTKMRRKVRSVFFFSH